jgi:hypothetical protein
MSGNLPNFFAPPYRYDDDTFCGQCDDEYFCDEHALDGPHEQGGDPPAPTTEGE